MQLLLAVLKNIHKIDIGNKRPKNCDCELCLDSCTVFNVSIGLSCQDTHTHTHPFNGPMSRTTLVGLFQKGKSNLDFTEARDSEWQWHQLGHMQVCTSLQTDNHANTPSLSFLQAGCPSCRPTNSVKALKAKIDVAKLPYT